MTFFRRITCILFAAGTVPVLGGCGGSGSPPATTAAEARPAILTAAVRPVTFEQVTRAVARLYREHPSIARFELQDVEYTPATRDKVLRVCHEGGPEKTAVALESARVLACAPLIFFFYSYGRASSDPIAVDVAQKLYWYAVTSNRRPRDSEAGLRGLLRRWGVR